MTSDSGRPLGLQVLDPNVKRDFGSPVKKINEESDVASFLTSKAYTDIVTFLLQLNGNMFPRKEDAPNGRRPILPQNEIDTPVPAVQKLAQLITVDLAEFIEQASPEIGPRRFGNPAYRTWHDYVEEDADRMLDIYLPQLDIKDKAARSELRAYFLGSFGSKQRLDYGTGHELSFLAFLAGIWKLGGFNIGSHDYGVVERAIVLGLVKPYFELIRTLIQTYTLEPAGSHGVWGLDDHSFLPYIFGSAQLGPAIEDMRTIPTEGSIGDAPEPGDVVRPAVVDREREHNLYFAAIGFIYDVKKGPFWEHSPMLYDISGIRSGWAKINKGMIKMYIAEVLSKFPVVQHFPFGGLFSWDQDPSAAPPLPTAHTSNRVPSRAKTNGVPAKTQANSQSTSKVSSTLKGRPPESVSSTMPSTKAPWANGKVSARATAPNGLPTRDTPTTRAPWASRAYTNPMNGNGSSRSSASSTPGTRAPWANAGASSKPSDQPQINGGGAQVNRRGQSAGHLQVNGRGSSNDHAQVNGHAQINGHQSAATMRCPWLADPAQAESPSRQGEPPMGPTKAPWA